MERYHKEIRKISHKVRNDFYNTSTSQRTSIRTLKEKKKDNPIEIGKKTQLAFHQ